MSDTSTWLIDLFEEQGPTMHRLAVMLGAESESGHILRTSLLGLAKRSNRIVDPSARVEYLAEQVVHQARSVRGPGGTLELLKIADPRQEEIRRAILALPIRLAEILLVSHYLSVFGPELAGIMRMTVRSCNQRLEEALDALRRAVGEPVSLPGVIESLSQELTAALRSAARLVQSPGTETLEAELRSLKGARAPGVPLLLAVLVVLLVLLLVISATWLFGRTHQATTVPTLVESPQSVSPQARVLPAQVQAVPVYYIGRQDGKLHREFRNLAASGEMVSTVVNAILAVAPLDPDYRSAWNPGGVIGVSREGPVVTVNLSADAFPDGTDQELTQQAIGQVVQAVHEVLDAPDLKVRFTANGEAPPAAFAGEHQLPGAASLAKLWIDTPGNGVRLAAGAVTFSGVVQPEAGQPRVLVTDSDDSLLASQYAQTEVTKDTEGWRHWSVSLNLEAGSYLVRVETSWTDDVGVVQTSLESRSITVE